MSVEKIIEFLEREVREYKRMIDDRSLCLAGESAYEECQSRIDFDYEIIALLRTHPDAQPNEPLTLEELRGMDVQPIYVVDRVYPPYSGWWIIGWTTGGCCVLAAAKMRGTQYIVQNYGIDWVAYRRPPKEA